MANISHCGLGVPLRFALITHCFNLVLNSIMSKAMSLYVVFKLRAPQLFVIQLQRAT